MEKESFACVAAALEKLAKEIGDEVVDEHNSIVYRKQRW